MAGSGVGLLIGVFMIVFARPAAVLLRFGRSVNSICNPAVYQLGGFTWAVPIILQRIL